MSLRCHDMRERRYKRERRIEMDRSCSCTIKHWIIRICPSPVYLRMGMSERACITAYYNELTL